MMFVKPALVACLAAAAQAILLPPSVSSSDTDIINTLPIVEAANIDSQSLNLACDNCPVASTDTSGNVVWASGLDSELQLTFVVKSNQDIDSLLLNGVQIYPPQAFAMEPIFAPQVTSKSRTDLRLGYEMTIRPAVKSETDQLELVEISLQIVEIADKFVNGLRSVELKLVKTSSGKLMIGNLATATTANPVINPSEDGSKCTTLICKWRAIVAGKLSALRPGKGKGCGSSKGKGDEGDIKPVKKPHHHGHDHPHHAGFRHKHHGIGRFFHALKNIGIHVFIPILVGLAVGMTAGAIGVLVGNVIIFTWRAMFRHGQHDSYSKVQQDEAVDREDDIKFGDCVEHHDTPPVYTDVVMDEKIAL